LVRLSNHYVHIASFLKDEPEEAREDKPK
jgi:hypothetical protein